MSWIWLRRLLKNNSRSAYRATRRPPTIRRFAPEIESLSERILPAVTATFIPAVGLLSVTGDAQNNTIVVSRDAAGKILVNGGAVTVRGGTATVANTTTISVFGLDGNDAISFDETNGALPKGQLFGGGGNDTLTGGSANDLLFGEAGNDFLLGKGGDDLLLWREGRQPDGRRKRQVFSQAGSDHGLESGEAPTSTGRQYRHGAGQRRRRRTFTIAPNGTRARSTAPPLPRSRWTSAPRTCN